MFYGTPDPFKQFRAMSFDEHIEAFKTALVARGATAKHVDDRMACLRNFATAAGIRCLGDLELGRATSWLVGLKSEHETQRFFRGKPKTKKQAGLSHRGVNRYAAALKQFGRWLARGRRWPFDPFDAVELLNQAEDRKYRRRALTTEEFGRLLTKAREQGEAGSSRAFCYLLATGTGLRRGELTRLRWCDVDLDKGRIVVPAKSAKARREQAVELHPGVVEALTGARPAMSLPTAPVLPAGAVPSVDDLRADLEAAKIEQADESGAVVDFHSLRLTFVSWLTASGAHPRTAQALARHSTVELTMKTYTDLRLLDLKEAVAKLPLPTSGERAEKTADQEQEKPTGTEGSGVSGVSPKMSLVACPQPALADTSMHSDDDSQIASDSETDDENCETAGVCSGTPARTRTWDLRFRKPLL